MAAVVSHRRGEHVRRTVLAAAFDELADNGAANASVAGVARRSGVHETTIYRRWATRENLFVDAMLSRSAQEIPAPDTGTIRGDLLAIGARRDRLRELTRADRRYCTRHCYRSTTVIPKRGMPFGPDDWTRCGMRCSAASIAANCAPTPIRDCCWRRW